MLPLPDRGTAVFILLPSIPFFSCYSFYPSSRDHGVTPSRADQLHCHLKIYFVYDGVFLGAAAHTNFSLGEINKCTANNKYNEATTLLTLCDILCRIVHCEVETKYNGYKR